MGVKCRLLLIEDDVALRSSLRLALSDEGFTVLEADSGRGGLARLELSPDAVLLDLGLPDIDGIEVCRRIRAVTGIPLVIITARTSPESIAAAFAAGADDFMPKPFAVTELAVRVRALLQPPRRPKNQDPERLAGLELLPEDDAVRAHGRHISLTRTEFRLLCELAAQPGRPVPAEELLRRVWGRDSVAVLPALEARISSLRHELNAANKTTPWITSAVDGYELRA
jgi:DNA-binding response OmpR family regulator